MTSSKVTAAQSGSVARIPLRMAGLLLLGLIALGALIGVWIARAGDTAGRVVQLSGEQSMNRVDDGLALQLGAESPARIRVERLSPDNAPELADLPPDLMPVGAVYRLETLRGGGTLARFTLPPSSQGAPIDLYHWEAERASWRFVPVMKDGDTVTAAHTHGTYVLVERHGPLELALSLTAGPLPDSLSVDWVVSGETAARADGSLQTSDDDTAASGNTSHFATVSIEQPETLTALLADATAREAHVAAVAALAGQYGGLVLEYGPVNRADATRFHTLIAQLANRVQEDGHTLLVQLPAPEKDGNAWQFGYYDLARLSAAVDRLIVPLPGSPAEQHPAGAADEFLHWVTTRVERDRLVLRTSAASIDEWAGTQHPITYDYALAPLGTVTLRGGADGAPPQPGDPLTFTLAGQAADLAQDASTGLYYYDVLASGGAHRIWVMTAAALQRRLDWLASHQPGAILVDAAASEQTTLGVVASLTAFQADQTHAPAPLTLAWQVRSASGAVLTEQQTGLATPFVWQPADEGEYVVSAELVGEESLRRGAAAVRVGEDITPEPTPTPLPARAGDQAAVVQPTPDPAQAAGLEPPVSQPGHAAFGSFELGGQVNQVLRYPDRMHQAGMTWVKYQLTWAPGQSPETAWNFVSQARHQGFKVLLSVVGVQKHPTEINVPAYLEFLRGVAYYGPDAIEVWNEPNYDVEWPRGEMDGGAYVRELLAPAYNAIKEVNPNIMVISAGLLPTGAYFGEGGCSQEGYGCDDWFYLQQMAEAGAANYMDCVGVHYNAGATAPSATTGHPGDPGYQHYSWYFGGMLQLYGGTFGHPVCFTELGYVTNEDTGRSLPANFSWAADNTVAEQADWLAEAAQLSRQSGQVRLMIVWNVDFTTWSSTDPKAGYAIIRPSGACPACETLGRVMQ